MFICVLTSLFLLFNTSLAGSVADQNIPCVARLKTSGYVCVCNATYCDTFNYPTPVEGQFTHISTSNHTPGFNSEQGSIQSASDNEATITVKVNSSTRFQELKGLGGSFTDSSCINVKNLSDKAGKNLLSSYFSPIGIEYKLGRVPIAASDYTTRTYTYDDTPGDVNLTHFNLTDEDFQHKIPVIEEAKLLSRHNMSLIGATWTSPSWTKTNDYYLPGYIRSQYYQYWAEYLIRFLDLYKKEGVEFWAVTAGNEPINPFIIGSGYNINNVLWLPMGQREFVRDHIGPLLRASVHNNTHLLTLDDTRWYLQWWMDRIMADSQTAQFIDGISLHWYRDTQSSPDILDQIFKKYNKFIIYTEACIIPRLDPGPTVDLGSWKRAELYILDIIETFNHWSIGFIDWNMALDLSGGPMFPLGGGTDGPIIVNATADEFYKNPIFYGLGHFSKFISEGSYRIESTSESLNISHLATANLDGSTSIFLYNPSDSNISISVEDVNKNIYLNINTLPKSINTVIWW